MIRGKVIVEVQFQIAVQIPIQSRTPGLRSLGRTGGGERRGEGAAAQRGGEGGLVRERDREARGNEKDDEHLQEI